MIEWLTRAQLDERLRAYPPIGLTLRPFFQARTSVSPEGWFSRAPQTADESGLGEIQIWTGLVDSLPFAVTAMPRRTGWGFEVRFPHRTDGDRVLLERLQSLGLPGWTHPYFSVLPSRGGFGVAAVGTTDPIYVAEQRADAAAAASFLNLVEPATYAVVAAGPSDPAWLVLGPESGPYVSRVEVMDDERAAVAQAERWSRESGAPFQVRRSP
jgi:hypothetical protein